MEKSQIFAVGYLRNSTEEQDITCAAQRNAIIRDAERRGITISGWFSDIGVSGDTPPERRPAFQQALTALKQARSGRRGAVRGVRAEACGAVRGVRAEACGAVRDTRRSARAEACGAVFFVAKLDRLTRGGSTLFEALEYSIRRAGAQLAYADGTPEAPTATAEFQRDVMRAVAKLELGHIRERTTAALAAKKARSERTGRIPYGQRLAPDGIHLEPNTDEQRVLQIIREWAGEGVSLRRIVARLNRDAPPPPGAKVWHLTTVHRFVATRMP